MPYNIFKTNFVIGIILSLLSQWKNLTKEYPDGPYIRYTRAFCLSNGCYDIFYGPSLLRRIIYALPGSPVLKCIEAGKQLGITSPVYEDFTPINFIR